MWSYEEAHGSKFESCHWWYTDLLDIGDYTKKKHILYSNSHEFHIFWVVIMPKMLNSHVVTLSRVTNKFYEVWKLFQGMILINWRQKR